MTGSCELLNLRAVVGEVMGALGRFDADRLDELAISCENWLTEPGAVGLEWGLSDTAMRGSREIQLFGLLLETTKANLRLICHPRLMSTVQLEYVPGAGQLGCGARD
jgi:hypothetical protein